MNLKQKLLILAFQHSIQHYRWTARLYRALANEDNNVRSRTTLLTLSRSAELQTRIALLALTTLDQLTPQDQNTTFGVWDWIFLKSNVAVTLAWLGWVEQIYNWLLHVLGKQMTKNTS